MRQRYYGDFGSLSFTKSGLQVIGAAMKLRDQLAAKVIEREQRLAIAAEESGMRTAGDVLLSLEAIAEGSSNAGSVDMNAGLAAKVKTEIAARAQERAEIKKLDLIISNLVPSGSFDLSFAELEYFGF